MAVKRQYVQRQVVLPLSRALEISFKSMRIRLGRSVITVSGIVLGIAFLMSIFTNNVVHKGLLENGAFETKVLLQGESVEFSARQIWLVSLSLLVCMVGITNAMLMSVSERYREIGTMKCLGALDSFIRKLFLLESLFMGLFGSIAGVIVGSSFVVMINLLKYGGEVFTTFGLRSFLLYSLCALVVGVVLAVIGALFPAAQASRMVPAEAMRTEI